MNLPLPHAPADQVLLLIAVAWLAAEALLSLAIAALALVLNLAGWRPARHHPVHAHSPAPPPPSLLPPMPPLEGLLVAKLLQALARAPVDPVLRHLLLAAPAGHH